MYNRNQSHSFLLDTQCSNLKMYVIDLYYFISYKAKLRVKKIIMCFSANAKWLLVQHSGYIVLDFSQ